MRAGCWVANSETLEAGSRVPKWAVSSPSYSLGPAWVGAREGGFSLLLRACERKGRVLGAQKAHPRTRSPERRLLEVKYERISGPVAPLQQVVEHARIRQALDARGRGGG